MLLLYVVVINFLVHGFVYLFCIHFRALHFIQIAMHLIFICLLNKTVLSPEALSNLA